MIKRSYIQGHQGHPHFISNKKIQSLKKQFTQTKQHQDTIKIIKALSDPTKLHICLLLQQVDEIPVSDIVNILGISQSSTSHALSALKKLDLVKSSRCGQLICYSLKQPKSKRKSILSIFNNLFNPRR